MKMSCQFVKDGGQVIEVENQDQVKPDGPLAVETYQRLVRARKFIDQCYHLPLDLQRISSEACLSRFHFLRLFRQAFNKTPHQVRELVQGGKLGACVFDTPDCQATYEELTAKGVEFISPPAEQPWGISAVFKDNSGNWFSLSQQPEEKGK